MSDTTEKTPDSPAETQSGGRVGLASDDLLSVEDIAFDILWELCSGNWQHIIKQNDTGEQRMAERIIEVVKMNNESG